MNHYLEIARSGLANLPRSPLRSGATLAALVAILLPFLAGLGVSHGLRWQAERALQASVDLCVTGTRLGRPAPLPVAVAERIARLEGVERVVPRIVGEIRLGAESRPALLIGLDPDDGAWRNALTCIRGRWFDPARPGEVVIGSELAIRLSLDVGSKIPPFYRSAAGERVSTVVGVFRSDVSLWQARLMVCSLATAQQVFDVPGTATDLLVSCRPGYEQLVADAVRREVTIGPRDATGAVQLRVATRGAVTGTLAETFLYREGIFNLHFVLAFAIGIPLLLVVSGIGLGERRREVAVLKCLGWQTDEVLLRAVAETLAIALAAVALAALLAWFWMRVLNGYLIAGIFIAGASASPDFQVPFRLAPVPIALTLSAALIMSLTGAIWSHARAALASPASAMGSAG